jgi:predicted neuraminidase
MIRSFITFLLLFLCAMALAAPRAEFIYETAPFPSCHASTIVETEPNHFFAAWFGGIAEGKPDVAIWGARKSRGAAWSEPFELAREPNIAAYNPVLFYSKDRTLWLYYKFGPSPATWTAGRRWSRDHGATWSAIEHLPAGLYGPIKNKPLLLPDGTIVSGTSVESYRSWSCWVERSSDNGKSWTRHGPIVAAASVSNQAEASSQLAAGSEDAARPHGIIQPAIVPAGGSRLRMFVRSTRSIGRICYADSSDGGVTWTEARPTSLPNPNSGIDAVGLRDGRIVLVYNHAEKERSPLNLAVSRRSRATDPGPDSGERARRVSYPAVIRVPTAICTSPTPEPEKDPPLEVPLKDIP